MKILAIPATNTRNGINRQIIGAAASWLEDAGAEVDIVDLNDYELPLFSMERLESGGMPDLARDFYDRIGAADGVVVSFAEHNGSYSVAWKNIYDWASRHDMRVYQGKKTALFATSPGPRGGRGVLEHAVTVAPFFGAEIVGSLSIPNFGENFDSVAGSISDPELRADFERILGELVGPVS